MNMQTQGSGTQASTERALNGNAPDPFAGGGEMGDLMRSIDWSKTPVGPVQQWPQSLITALSILLRQKTAVFIFWGPEHVQFYNDAYRPILGTSKHPAAMGQRGCDCWPEIWDIIEPMLDAVHRGESTAVEDGLLVMDRSGYLEEGYYTYTYSPISDEAGSVGGVFCVVYDTTGRVIGERRLRTLRDLASRVMAKDAETACRIAASTLASNPHDIPFAALYLFAQDRKRAELVGVAGVEAGSRAAPEAIAFDGAADSTLASAARSGNVEVLENFAAEAGPLPGGPWPVGSESAIVLPLMVPGQNLPVGFMVAGMSPRKRLDASYRTFFELAAGQIATAVAESRAYEEERKRAEALAELDRAKTAFFSNVSHEFRTPLTLMLGPVADLLSRDTLPEEMRQELDLVHRNALRLLKLVNSLLDFSRIEAGRIQASYEPTDLAALTADLASVFRSAIEKAGIRLTIDCPPLNEPVFVDHEMWENIVLNLLSNAFKFTFEGEISVAVRAVDGNVELSVRDTGTGIEEAELAHVFDRFHRIEGARGRSQEGSGIGLALVQELARLHGGSVRVESKVGEGSVFTVSIPLGSSHLPQDRIGQPRRRTWPGMGAQSYLQEALRWLPDAPVADTVLELPSTGEQENVQSAVEAPAPRARVVLADDNADMRDYLRRLLSSRYEVESVSDGAAALASIRSNTPALVIADVMMPRLDGFGLMRAIRNDAALRSLPVILLSARAGEEARVEGLQAGADDYVVKPFSAREFLVRISSRLEIARLREMAAQSEQLLRLEAQAEREKLRGLIAQAPAVVALLRGPEHVFEVVNREYCHTVGRSETELIGKPIREALPEIQDQPFPALLDEVYRTGKAFTASEMRAQLDRHGDGRLEEVYFNFIYQPWTDSSGQVAGIIVHAVDVTAQVLARRRVEESERQLQTLADSIPQLAWMADPDGYITWYNRRWYEFTGTTPEQMAGWGWRSVHDPEILPQVLQRWRESLDTGDPFEMEFPLRGADGEYRWFLTRVKPLRDASGAIMRWFGTNTDVMEIKRMRDERATLLEAEREARGTAELLNQVGPTLVSELDFGKLAQSIIDLATSLTGAEIGVLCHTDRSRGGDAYIVQTLSRKRGVFETFPSQAEADRLLRMFDEHGIIRFEDLSSGPSRPELSALNKTAHGQVRIRSFLAAPILSRTREIVGGLLFAHSRPEKFTNRHERILAGIAAQAAVALENAHLFAEAQRIQRDLEKSNEELRRLNSDLETFAYSASHDLREPLRNIAIGAQLLRRDYKQKFDDTASMLLDGIVIAAKRMDALTEDLLAYTRAAQHVSDSIVEVDANAVLAETLSGFEAAIGQTGATVTSDALPSLKIHRAHLALLFQNLVGNALKYRSEQPPRIHVSASQQDGVWTFCVADNGIGIEPKYRTQVFGLFKRLHGHEKYSGSGVGLAICQRIVEHYGGRIWADAGDLGGTTFSFTIPDRSR